MRRKQFRPLQQNVSWPWDELPASSALMKPFSWWETGDECDIYTAQLRELELEAKEMHAEHQVSLLYHQRRLAANGSGLRTPHSHGVTPPAAEMVQAYRHALAQNKNGLKVIVNEKGSSTKDFSQTDGHVISKTKK